MSSFKVGQILILLILCFSIHIQNTIRGELIGETSSVPLLTSSEIGDEPVRQIKFGETLKLDELGPIIINPDGTTRRISNWNDLSTQEQKSSWRLIAARNQKRIKKLQTNVDIDSGVENL
jgi:hypothetical protein